MLYSLGDRIHVVQITLEDEGVLLRIKAAKAIRWRRFGEYVQRLGIRIKRPEMLRGLVPFFQTFVEVLEMLHECQGVEGRIVLDVQALPKFGPSFGRLRVRGPKKPRNPPDGDQQVLNGIPKKLSVTIGFGLFHVLEGDHGKIALTFNLALKQSQRGLLHETFFLLEPDQ